MQSIRPKVLIAVLAVVLVPIIAFVFLSSPSGEDTENATQPEPPPMVDPGAQVPPANPPAGLPTQSQAPVVPPANPVTQTVPPAPPPNAYDHMLTNVVTADMLEGLDENLTEEERNREILVRRWYAQLDDLWKNDDPGSMQIILGAMQNPIPDVRYKALEAIQQFGSEDAIPRLEKIAEETKDPREKVAILDTIEYLKLPSLTDVLKGRTKDQPDPEAE